MGGRAGINHLISRESTMDIGVMGDRHPNSGQEERKKNVGDIFLNDHLIFLYTF